MRGINLREVYLPPDTNRFYVTEKGSSNLDGSNWKNSFNTELFFNYLETRIKPNDTIWINTGNYKLTRSIDFSHIQTTEDSPINFIGVTKNTEPIYFGRRNMYQLGGSDQPTIILNEYTLKSCDWCYFHNFKIEV